jgi:hypothetical protein
MVHRSNSKLQIDGFKNWSFMKGGISSDLSIKLHIFTAQFKGVLKAWQVD